MGLWPGHQGHYAAEGPGHHGRPGCSEGSRGRRSNTSPGTWCDDVGMTDNALSSPSGPTAQDEVAVIASDLIRIDTTNPGDHSGPGERAAATIGRLTAHLATLRQMSLSVAMMLQAGQNPNLEAAVVKDVGTSFEQEIPETVHALMGVEPRLTSGSPFERTLGFLVENAPSFSLRGGTREVLRGIIARGLGLR